MLKHLPGKHVLVRLVHGQVPEHVHTHVLETVLEHVSR